MEERRAAALRVTSPRQVHTDRPIAQELPGLDEMFAEVEAGPELLRPSRYWQEDNRKNLQQLADDGFDEFKRTVNCNYFQWLPVHPFQQQFRAGMRRWLDRPTPRILTATPARPLRDVVDHVPTRMPVAVRERLYALYVAALWEYARRRDRWDLLGSIEEPPIGNPASIRYRGREITEDLCNSFVEIASIADAIGLERLRRARVVELGPGYGRVAWLYTAIFPQSTYVLVDIPPALGVAQRYLSSVFPDRRIFRFRRFQRYEDVAAELRSSQIAFLTPNQLGLIEPLRADLFLNISSLHEMTHRQIASYLEAVDAHTEGHFYTKQWIRWHNPRDDIVVTRESYPIPSDWVPMFDRTHPVHTQFFEALYRVPGSAGPDGHALPASTHSREGRS